MGGAAKGSETSEGVRVTELEKQLQICRNELREAEKKLEARHWVAPLSLQHWMQLTHELELRNYNTKKAKAEQQLQAAKEGVSNHLSHYTGICKFCACPTMHTPFYFPTANEDSRGVSMPSGARM